jgi:hypothetical protein
MKTPRPIARADLEAVTGGATSPLGTLSLFIARTGDASRSVAKSFDVLTLASPPVSVPRFGPDDGVPLRIGSTQKRQTRGTTRVDRESSSSSSGVDDASRPGGRGKRRI